MVFRMSFISTKTPLRDVRRRVFGSNQCVNVTSLFVCVGDGLSFEFSGEGFEELRHFGFVRFRHFATNLVAAHHGDSLGERFDGAIVIVGPGECDVAERRSFEAIAVAFHLRLCPSSVVGIGESGLGVDFSVFEVVRAPMSS